MTLKVPRIKPRQKVQCVIWPEYSATQWEDEPGVHHISSPRADGVYRISQETMDDLESAAWLLTPDVAKKLTTYLIDQRNLGQLFPLVTSDIINNTALSAYLPVHVRAERLLRYISIEIPSIGQYVHFTKKTEEDLSILSRRDDSRTTTSHVPNLKAYAWSESEDWEEVEYLLNYLESRGWIQFTRNDSSGVNCIVTVDGYTKIGEVETRKDLAQCFVAMWFDPSMEEAYEDGIRPAVESAGYTPLRIDRKKDLSDKIDDAVIAEIRRSRFIVADFTHGADGARGSVYYEAGFAHGLSIPVIFLCKEERMQDLHFDTRQYPHIDWTTPEDLHERLKDRILALFGAGPELTD